MKQITAQSNALFDMGDIQSKVLQRLVQVGIVALVILFGVLIVTNETARYPALLVGIASFLLIEYLRYKGQIRIASWAFVTLSTLIIIESTFTTTGIYNPSTSAFFIIIFVVGVLISRQAALIYTGLVIIVGFIIALQTPDSRILSETITGLPSPLLHWAIQSILLAAIGIIVYYTVQIIIRTYVMNYENRLLLDKSIHQLQAERTLRDQVLETSPVGILMFNAEGQITYTNPQVETILQLKPQEILGRKHDEPEWNATDFEGKPIPVEKRPFAVARSTREPVYHSQIAINMDGSERKYLSVNAAPILDDDGEVTQVVLAIQDSSDLVKTYEALRESEERWRRLADATFEGIVVTDSGTIIENNWQFAELFGYKKDELIGMKASEFVAPESRELVYRHILSGYDKPYEHMAVHKDGTIFPIEVQARTIQMDGKEVRVTAMRDIAERRKAEADLRASELRFRTLFENMPDAVFILDHQTQKIIDCNTAACEMNGYEREELVGESIDLLNWAETPEKLRSIQSEHFRVINEYGTLQGEIYHRRKDGTVFPIEFISTRIDIDGHELAIGIDRDITERKRAEQDLKNSELRFRMLFENIPDAVFLIDNSNMTIIDCNPAACEMNGYEREELVGHPIDLLNYEPDPEVWARRNIEHFGQLNTRGIAHRETYHRRKDGSIFPIEYIATLLHINGKEITLGIDRDITERRQSEEALKNSELRFRTLFENMPDGIHILDHETLEIVDCNQVYCDMHSYKREELIGQHIDLLNYKPNPQQDIQRRIEIAEEIERIGTVFRETLHRRKDGEIFPVEYVTTLITINNRKLRIGINRDITERKQAEDALKDSELRFRTLFENMPDAVFIMDYETLEILDCNDVACKMNGYTREELVGQHIDLLNYEPDPEFDEVRRKLNNPILERDGVITQEVFHRRKDGTIFPIENLLTTLTINGRKLLLGMDRDITERKQAEDALRSSELRFRTLFENMPDAVFISEADKIIDCNTAACTMNGYTREELIGNSVTMLNHEPDEEERLRIQQYNLEQLDKTGVTHQETYHRHKDGTIFPIEYIISRITLNGRNLAISIDRDITERREAEDALRAGELRFRTLFENMPDAVFIIDYETREIIDCNTTACTMNGYEREELVGQKISIVNHEPDPENAGIPNQAFLNALLQQGIVYQQAYHKRKDGTIFPIEYVLTLININGRDLMIGIDRDITERREAEDALRASELRFRTLFENMPDAVFIIDLELDTIIDCNTAACEMNGYAREELIGQSAMMLNYEPDEDERLQLHERHTQQLNQGGVAHQVVYHQRKDGTVFPIEYIASLININGRNLMIGIDRDITERREAEEALRASELRFRTLFENMPDAVIITDRVANKIIDCNAAACEMNGYTREELIGQSLTLINYAPTEEERLKIHHRHLDQLEQNGIVQQEVYHRHKDGTIFPIEYIASRIVINGQDLLIGIDRDITERLEAEKQRLDLAVEREKVEFLREFMNNMTHDLKTPLSTIKTSLYLLERVKSAEQHRARVNIIYQQTEVLEQIVDDILTISRLEHVPHLDMHPTDLNMLLEQTIEKVRVKSEAKQQSMITDLADTLPEVDLARDELLRAILNLVDNAVNYTPETGQIKITSRKIDNRIIIEVADTGIGISENDLPNVFNRFFRARNARNIKGGTGLGLAIVKKVIDLHGGTIEVSSVLEEGTTFHIELPANHPEAALSM